MDKKGSTKKVKSNNSKKKKAPRLEVESEIPKPARRASDTSTIVGNQPKESIYNNNFSSKDPSKKKR